MLITANQQHLLQVATWFNSPVALFQWGGPNLSFPTSAQLLANEIKLSELPSFSLISNNNEVIAFGQYYLRLNRCHLGRLVVNPNFQGQGYGKKLVDELMLLGGNALKTNEYSLFVLAHNTVAKNLYIKCGFIEAVYPEPLPIDNCLYMVRNSAA